jgi:hypothetical protein
MKYQEHTTKSGKFIRVWDDLIPYAAMGELFYQLRNEPMPLALQNDTCIHDFDGKYGFGKNMESPAWLKTFIGQNGVNPDNLPLVLFLDRCVPIRCWINLQTGYDVSRYHGDHGDSHNVSLLYYANTKWDIEWDGGTAFRTDDLSEIEFVSDYKPGRLVLFDSSIPHKPLSTSMMANHYRYTINSTYINKNKMS